MVKEKISIIGETIINILIGEMRLVSRLHILETEVVQE